LTDTVPSGIVSMGCLWHVSWLTVATVIGKGGDTDKSGYIKDGLANKRRFALLSCFPINLVYLHVLD
jgi:hypothetical protein